MHRAAFLLPFALASCNRTPSVPGAAGSASPPASAASGAPDAHAARPLPDGCWQEVDRRSEPAPLLQALGAECAADTRALAPATRGELAEGHQLEQALVAPEGGLCVRALAAGAPTITDLSLEVRDGRGRLQAEQTLFTRFALLDLRGPVCLAAGRYTVVARARVGSGPALLELRAPRSSR